jgi:hypothetical protein
MVPVRGAAPSHGEAKTHSPLCIIKKGDSSSGATKYLHVPDFQIEISVLS